MERVGPFIDVKLNLQQQRQSGFPPALQRDPYFNLALRRSIDCRHAPPGAARLEESGASRLHSISLLHPPGAQARARSSSPPSRIKPLFPPDRLVCWVCCCRGGTVCPSRVPGQEIRTSTRRKTAKGRESFAHERTDRKHTSEGALHDYSFGLKKTRGHR